MKNQCRFVQLLCAVLLVAAAVAPGQASAEGRQVRGAECRKNWRSKLQIIHSSDNESSFQDPNSLEEKVLGYAAVTRGLQRLASRYCVPSLHLTAGDHTIPGPFYQAAAEVPELGQPGLADIAIFNAMKLDANGLGNHEFDGGIDQFAQMLHAAEYPMIAVNLDFSQVQLAAGTPSIETAPDGSYCPRIAGKVTKSCWLWIGGHRVGLIGRAPADFFNVISNPSVTLPGLDFVGGRDASSNQPLVSAVDQVLEQVEVLEDKGVNRIILLDHAQDFTADPLSASSLRGIDIIVAAGSTGFMARPTADGPFNFLRPEDSPSADYPTVRADMDGNTVLVVNSEQLFRYTGHLVVEFNRKGFIEGFDEVSGPIATNPEGVARLAAVMGQSTLEPPSDVSEVLAALQNTPSIVDAFSVVGTTNFPLNGLRVDVRTRETNLAKVVAASTVWGAQAYANANPALSIPAVDIGLKNGGGIRDNIQGPNIIRLTIQAALAFDNKLAIVELTGEQLLAALENAVSRFPAADGRFPQLANAFIEFDETRPGVQGQAALSTPSRIKTLIVTRADGTLETIVDNYAVVTPNLAAYRVVLATNDFLTTGGDGYSSLAAAARLGTTGIGEQQILEDYITNALGGVVDEVDPPVAPNVVELP